ncbi:hypothetical protein [Nocardia farcinica]|nr:hypothetical protein [Nocardia farcinica]
MAEPHVDNTEHGHITWWKGFGPANYGPYTGTCPHHVDADSWLRPVAWGWDFKHYTLDQCQRCGARAWHDERIRPTTQWIASRPDLVGVSRA